MFLLAFGGVPFVAYAQETTLIGTITDSTGAVLPGATVTAANEATGNTFVAVTDARGAYLIPLRVGSYTLTAELTGFGSVNRPGIQLLVGQQAVVHLQLSLSSVQESVTVTGAAPLVDLTQSKVGGNVDPRQMSDLPVNGRDWMNLAILTPGARQNAVQDVPMDRGRGAFQVNLDGQQVTTTLVHGAAGSTGAMSRLSRDSIAEFEVIENRFDATQGRSSGIQVNVISKSGTNVNTGSVAGYFRDDRFNAADFIQHRVLPYSNQQISATWGGPIVKDKLHYFASWEFEHEPRGVVPSSKYPTFNIQFPGVNRQNMGSARLDYQKSTQSHLSVRTNLWRAYQPDLTTLGATLHPSTREHAVQSSEDYFGSLLTVFGTRGLNELKGGFHDLYYTREPYVQDPNSVDEWMKGFGSPQYLVQGYTLGASTTAPQFNRARKTQITDNYSLRFDGRGRHALKVGGEFLYYYNHLYFCNFCNGNLDALGGPAPANLEALFPVWNDASTWNVNALSPLARTWQQSFGNMTEISPRQTYAAWVQDDWSIHQKFTLNLGLRYDLYINALGEDVVLLPFIDGHRHAEKTNIQPRVGFAWSLSDRTVIRGGGGLYYAEVQGDHFVRTFAQQASVSIPYDGRTDFASNPWKGPAPTYEQALQYLCRINRRPGCLRTVISSKFVNPHFQIPYTYQSSIGVQRQVGSTVGIEADYVYSAGRHESIYNLWNVNLSYNPATGANYPFTDTSRLPYPDFALVNMDYSEGWSNLHSVSTALTKRYSHRWQGSATYTLSWLKDGTPAPLTVDLQPVATFPLAEDIGKQYGYAATDQRHRFVFNGIVDVGLGFQVSGLYFYGSGQRFATTWGADLRQSGESDGRLRPDGTIVPRNNFVGRPIHRVDMRLLRKFRLSSRVAVDGMVEIFNAFNHANYGSYVTQQLLKSYGQPTGNSNIAYQPRKLQLGFRCTF
jgi:hypothetical protein